MPWVDDGGSSARQRTRQTLDDGHGTVADHDGAPRRMRIARERERGCSAEGATRRGERASGRGQGLMCVGRGQEMRPRWRAQAGG
jgi:hypothetical protein